MEPVYQKKPIPQCSAGVTVRYIFILLVKNRRKNESVSNTCNLQKNTHLHVGFKQEIFAAKRIAVCMLFSSCVLFSIFHEHVLKIWHFSRVGTAG